MTACEVCFAPVDVVYDYDALELRKISFNDRPRSIWRYHELLPLNDRRNIIDLNDGFTPLVKCSNLGEVLGLKNLYVKNDSVNPTFSFKDRPASVAVSKAVEFGDEAVGCASTGNLAGAVAAHAGKARLPCYILAPANLEISKITQTIAYGAKIIAIRGTYDDANRLAVLASEEFGWNLVNVTSRPYYVEGSKTIAFEVCEQLGWKAPDQIIIPIASGALLCAIYRGFQQFKEVGLISEGEVKINGAQAAGCGPVAEAFEAGAEKIKPVEVPHTLAKSIAIGDPGDGNYVLQIARKTKGVVGGVSDPEIVEAIRLLARYEGIFTEPAGGVTIALLKRMVEDDLIDKDEIVVSCVTGNGLKTEPNVLIDESSRIEIEPNLDSLDEAVKVWGE